MDGVREEEGKEEGGREGGRRLKDGTEGEGLKAGTDYSRSDMSSMYDGRSDASSNTYPCMLADTRRPARMTVADGFRLSASH